MVINRLGKPAAVLRNDATAPRIAVRLRGTPPNTFGSHPRPRLIAIAAGVPMQIPINVASDATLRLSKVASRNCGSDQSEVYQRAVSPRMGNPVTRLVLNDSTSVASAGP